MEAKRHAADSLETRIYREIAAILGNEANRRLVRESFPRPEVTRRNTGYAQEDCDVLVAPEWQKLFETKALEVLRGL